MSLLNRSHMSMYHEQEKRPVTRTGTKVGYSLESCLAVEVRWVETGNPQKPWRAAVGKASWEIQVNDFPAEPLYTVFIDGERVGDFDDWPSAWRR